MMRGGRPFDSYHRVCGIWVVLYRVFLHVVYYSYIFDNMCSGLGRLVNLALPVGNVVVDDS